MKTDPTPQTALSHEHADEDHANLDVYGGLKGQYSEAQNEDIEQERHELVDRIRDRDPLDIAQNTERTLAGIERSYLKADTSKKHGLGKAISQARRLRKLRRKADTFAKAFDKTVFSDIEHAGPDLGDEVELKSPAALAKEEGLDIKDKAKHSGGLDMAMGNTDYVFATTKALASVTSLFGRERYKITSDEGYVVSTDISYMHPTRKMIKAGDYGVMQLGLYADNIHTIPGFKKVFALYSAALFDSPDEALGFYQTYKHMMSQGGRWDLDEDDGGFRSRWSSYGAWAQHSQTEFGRQYTDSEGAANDKSHAIALVMRELVERYNIYPPIEPEFQFKDKVAATRITKSS